MEIQFHSRKFWLIAFALLLGVILVGQASTQDVAAQTIGFATINTESKSVHANPDTTSTVIDTVFQDDIVLLLGRNEDSSWVYVITPNLFNGWITTTNITADIPITSLPVVSPSSTPIPIPTNLPEITSVPATGTVNTGRLNVRSGPGVEFGIVTTLNFGDTVGLIARNADSTWLYIRTTQNVEGWVNARYITTSYPITSLPVVGSTATSTPGAPVATATPPGPTAAPSTAYVTASTLNVRAAAGLSYPRVDQVYNSNAMWVNGRNLDTTWVSVITPDNVAGWVNSKYVTSNINFTTLPVISQTGTGLVLTGSLNVRSAPGAGSSILTSAYQGANMTIIGRTSDNTWLYLRAPDGIEGWSNASYLSTSTDLNALPVLSGPVPTSSVPTAVAPAPVPPVYPPTDSSNTAVLRSCPNLACSVTGQVFSGLTITATGRTADSTWVYVTTSNNQQGWIPSQFVQLNIPISSLPVMN